MWFWVIAIGIVILANNLLPKPWGDRVMHIAGAVLFGLLFAALAWWFMRQCVIFILQVGARVVKGETKLALRLAEIGHHAALDPIALILGFISGVTVVLLPDHARNMALAWGPLILIGVTGVLYLMNRFVFGDESAGTRGF